MDYQTSKSRYILTSLSIIIVITAFILIGLNAYLVQQGGGIKTLSVMQTPTNEEINEAYKRGFETARQRAEGLCSEIKPTNESFIGTIVSNDGKRLVVTQETMLVDFLVDNVSDQRTILFNEKTEVYRNEKKSDAQFNLEMNSFEAKIKAGERNADPPNDMIQKSLKFSELKTGQKVIISGDKDLSRLENITALKIRLLP